VEIHSVDEKGKVSRYKKMPASLEKEIEDFIENNPDILEKDLMIIGRQIDTDEGNTVDLIGLDKESNVVIIEIKKDEAPRKVISQVLDYGVWAQDLTYEKLNEIAKQNHLPNRKTLMEKFQEWTNEIDPEWNQTQKLYVIAEKIDQQTEKLAKYLREKGIEIFCIELNFYEKNGHRLVQTHEVVGEEITPRQISGPLSEEDHMNKGSELHQKLYSIFKENVLKLGNDIKVNPVKYYIGFSRNGKNFLAVRIRKSSLRITLVPKGELDDPKMLASKTQKSHYGGRLRRVELNEEQQIPDLIDLVKQTYEAMN